MDFSKLSRVHIVGIGGCASSAIAEYLTQNKILVTGSELKKRDGLSYLENLGVKIYYGHSKENIYYQNKAPECVLYSPAVTSLDPNNPEILECKTNNIPLLTWQEFIGDYLNTIGKIGITVSGSEGKGTTGGILTMILKDTEFDPLSILGAKIKKINKGLDSNIYTGEALTYILEGDEFNRNFYNYHPSINITINFQFEHPETYKDFDDYKSAFYNFFKNMNGDVKERTLILRHSENLISLVDQYNLNNSHKIIWFGDDCKLLEKIEGKKYLIDNHKLSDTGNEFDLTLIENNDRKTYNFNLPFLPGYIIYNATGAIIAAFELGLNYNTIQKNIKNFCGMVRRFDVNNMAKGGVIITDYGHSPESVNHIIKELRNIYKGKKIHIIFQPHLFSRTDKFFTQFVEALRKSDKISLVDIYPAREKPEDWINKISSLTIYEELKKKGCSVYYAGKSCDIYKTLSGKIDPLEVTCFLGAGDMDLYYNDLIRENVK